MAPELVPGVVFTNAALDEAASRLIDMAPTILDLFGVEVPAYMAGRSMLKK
jgi:bisphosphoglycerate-independent phosphoglycerate mutase (AlkP superfamily)